MTTITIDRTLLVRMEKELFLARNYGGILRDEPLLNEVSAALSAPATAQAAEIERLKTESEERLQNCAALVAENEQLRWAVKDALAQLQRGDFADAESTLSVTAMKETP